jgi:hypothetical protein
MFIDEMANTKKAGYTGSFTGKSQYSTVNRIGLAPIAREVLARPSGIRSLKLQHKNA